MNGVGAAIGIDIGTSGVRAALITSSGDPIALQAAPVAPEHRRSPLAWWAALEAALAGLRAAAELSSVAAIAVDGTSGTVLAIDAEGNPLGDASLYNDPADAAAARRVAAAAPPASAAHGATSPLAKLLRLQSVGGIARMLHQADWIAGRLCGRFDITDENNALKTGYDPVARRWPDWLRELGTDAALLPEVVEPGTVIGHITVEMAQALGLPDEIRVAAGTTDGCAAFLATGASAIGEAVTSLGSTLTLKQLSPRPLFAPDYGVYSHRLGDLWLAGGASNSGGAVLAQHFAPDRIAALSAHIDPLKPTPLDYYPLPAPGERFPIADPALAPRITPRPDDDAAFLHGLLEGIARIEALGYQRLRDLGGPPLVSLRSVGGGARNAAWSAIRARILGIPLAPARSEEAAVGTAILALRALR
jgi:sugar (pentulose or hexulose) kinase